MSDPLERVWDAGHRLDVRATLAPLRRGSHDPAHRLGADGRFWLAAATPDGDGTLAVSVEATTRVAQHTPSSMVFGQAWGEGATWLLERMPRLLGADDDWSTLDVSAHRRVHEVYRRNAGLRLTSTGLILDALIPAILEQKVTGKQAWSSWRGLVQRFGTPAPGPDPMLRVPPSPRVLLDVPSWDWHRLGVEIKRQRTIRAVVGVATRLEECASMPRDAAVTRLLAVPGVGPWTVAETLQRAIGHPDLVSVGDYHLPNMVVHLLTGRARGTDAEMLELLEPWTGQRQRVMRLIEAARTPAPRFGPRFSPTDMRNL